MSKLKKLRAGGHDVDSIIAAGINAARQNGESGYVEFSNERDYKIELAPDSNAAAVKTALWLARQGDGDTTITLDDLRLDVENITMRQQVDLKISRWKKILDSIENSSNPENITSISGCDAYAQNMREKAFFERLIESAKAHRDSLPENAKADPYEHGLYQLGNNRASADMSQYDYLTGSTKLVSPGNPEDLNKSFREDRLYALGILHENVEKALRDATKEVGGNSSKPSDPKIADTGLNFNRSKGEDTRGM